MSLDPGRALGLNPPERMVLRRAKDAVGWARSIPDFGWEPEVYALFLDEGHGLLRATWLGASTTFADFAAWPDFVLGYAPPTAAVAAVVLLVCRPGAGAGPSPTDRDTWDLVRLAHAARGVPVLDVVMVDGLDWCSLAESLEP